MSSDIEYRRLRAPAAKQGFLIDPPLAALHQIDAWQPKSGDTPDRTGAPQPELLGLEPPELLAMRRATRRELAELLAARGIVAADLSNPAAGDQLWLLSGHQPQLYHPGVWFKNFLLSHLARRHSAVAFDIVIDHDLCRNVALRVPAGTVAAPAVRHVAWDLTERAEPYEDRRLKSRSTLATVPERVASLLPRELPEPLLSSFWKNVVALSQDTDYVGDIFARARHRLERSWGVTSYQLPMSVICSTRSFARFVAQLIAQADRFRAAYNTALARFRTVHRLRNQAHPAPDLLKLDSAIEIPFWIWRREQLERKGAFIRRHTNGWSLGDATTTWCELKGSSDEGLVDSLWQLQKSEIRLRPRALTTTLFLRTLVADLFVHGIGGAKYDQVTDWLIEHWYGVRPSPIVVASATLKLDLPVPACPEQALRSAQQLAWQVRHHPEWYLSDAQRSNSDIENWLQRKREAIEQPVAGGSGKARFQAISAANEGLRSATIEMAENARSQIQSAQHQIQLAKLWGSREFPFVLYPEEELQQAYHQSLFAERGGKSASPSQDLPEEPVRGERRRRAEDSGRLHRGGV